MANNVTFKVSFEQINKAAKERLKEMFSRFQDNDCNFGDMFVDGKEGSPTYEETNTRNWYNENVGSKWCYFEEYDDDYLFGRSAWAPPSEGFHWLAEQLGEVDPELLMNVSFEDEMPNFVGWAVFEDLTGNRAVSIMRMEKLDPNTWMEIEARRAKVA